MRRESVSWWIRNNAIEVAETNLKRDVDSMNRALDRQCSLSKKAKIVFIEGNHDHWPIRAMGAYPMFREYLDVPNVLHLKERGVKFMPENIPYRIGKICWVHGDCFGQNPGKYHSVKMVQDWGSVIYGHTHTVQSHTLMSPIDIDDKRIAYNIGCLCNKNPGYMRNRPNSWVHAFGLTYVRSDGFFTHTTIPIIKGKFVHGGHVYG